MAYLQREKIPFVLRLRENQYALREGYAAMSVSAIARHPKVQDKMIVKGECRLGCQNETMSSPVRPVVMRLTSGELLALVCSGSPHHALVRYRQRWTIGVSSEGHAVMLVKVRPEPKDSGFEAREAPWRESKTAEPSDNMLERSVREASGCNVQ